MRSTELALFLFLAFLWGSAFIAISIGVESMTPAELVAGRMLLGGAVITLTVLALGKSLNMGSRAWGISLVTGLSGNVLPFWLISYAGKHVDTGLSALIMGIAPIVTICLAPLLLNDETLTKAKGIGALVGFAGLTILFGPSVLLGLGAELLPQIALLGAALCYAGTTIFTRRFPHSDPMQIAAGSVLLGALVMSGVVLLGNGGLNIPEVSSRSFWALVYLGIGPTAVAAMIFFYLVPKIGAGRLQQVNNLVPLVGVGLGIVVMGETPSWNLWLSLPIIMLAVFLVTRRRAR